MGGETNYTLIVGLFSIYCTLESDVMMGASKIKGVTLDN
jgi:hypothetical protein